MTKVMLETKQMSTVRETMALLDVSRPTIMRWLQDGKFANAVKADGLTGEWNIPRVDIETIRSEMIAEYSGKIEKLKELSRLK